MDKTKPLTERIAGKTKQAIGEILGDQALHDEGKAQAADSEADARTPERQGPVTTPKTVT